MTNKPARTKSKTLGRPSGYSQELADRICDELSDGRSLRTVCLSEDLPDKATVFRWLREDKEFRDQYTRAKEESADAMSEDVLDISDDGSNDWMEKNFAGQKAWVTNGEALQRSRLRVDTRKWLMAKMKPKKYGDKIELDGKIEHVIPILGGKSNVQNTNLDIKVIDSES